MNIDAQPLTALIVSVSDGFRENLAGCLQHEGFGILSVDSVPAALSALYSKPISLIVVNGIQDASLALESCKTFQGPQNLIEKEVLFIYAEASPPSIDTLLSHGATECVQYPVDWDSFQFKINFIQKRIEKKRALHSLFVEFSKLQLDIEWLDYPEPVKRIASILNVNYALISQRTGSLSWRAKTVSFWNKDDWGKNFEYDLDGSPCEIVYRDGPQWFGPDIQDIFPTDSALKKLNIQFYAGAPVLNQRREAIGHLCVLHDKPVAYDPVLTSILEAFAAQFSIKFERNASTLIEGPVSDVGPHQPNTIQEQEIEIGSKIQQTLLLGKTPTDIPALNVAASSIPSQRIDGDFYDFFHVDETRLDVLVGDVMGKGVPAALLGAAVKSHFQRAMRKLLAARSGGWPEPREIVARVHRAMTGQLIKLESFFTLFYMRFDVKQSECVYLDCGHMPTIWYQAKHHSSRLIRGDNLPLGVSEGEQFVQRTFHFEPGDFFVMYSDGLTEAPSPSGELFGVERLQTFVDNNNTKTPNQLIDAIYHHLSVYTNAKGFSDDLTCVIVQINKQGAAASSKRKQSVFNANLSELEQARAFLQAFYDESDLVFDDDFMQKITLAMNEAAANIIEHAYKDDKKGKWALIVEELQDRWVVSMLHDGLPFDPEETPDPAFDGSKSSGFGVYIIRNCVDEVVYGRHDDGRCLVQLMKRFVAMKGMPE